MQKIMLNDRYGLTKAVLEGRKTMTRRIVPEKVQEAYYDYDDYVRAVAPRDIPCSREYEEEFFLRRARFEVGEVVAVAQSYGDIFRGMTSADYMDERFNPLLSKGPHLENEAGWTNKMFVKADLMPHHIRITNIRVEQLQDISDEDCLREGVFLGQFHTYSFVGRGRAPFNTPREAFAALIDKVSGKGTWKANPEVYVYEFELVK